MDPITIILSVLGLGGASSLIMSLVTKLISDKTSYTNSKIKVGDSEIEFSDSANETLKSILEKVQQLQNSPQVFISYSSRDQEFVQKLIKDLRKNDIRVWITDEQVQIGDVISSKIQEGIASSQWIIIVLSENSSASNFVNKELLFALSDEQKRNRPFILPVVISDTELPTQLQDRLYADFRNGYESGLEKILARIKPSLALSDITSDDKLALKNENEIANIFILLTERLNALPNITDKQDVRLIIETLENEAQKQDKADERTIKKSLDYLLKIAPDVEEIVLETLSNPIGGLSSVFKKVAERIKSNS